MDSFEYLNSFIVMNYHYAASSKEFEILSDKYTLDFYACKPSENGLYVVAYKDSKAQSDTDDDYYPIYDFNYRTIESCVNFIKNNIDKLTRICSLDYGYRLGCYSINN